MNFLYFHVNHRFIVQGFLEYFPLIHSGSWDNPIFEMTILLIFKKKSIFITIKSRPCSRKSIGHTIRREEKGKTFIIKLLTYFIRKPLMKLELLTIPDLKVLQFFRCKKFFEKWDPTRHHPKLNRFIHFQIKLKNRPQACPNTDQTLCSKINY